MFAGLSIEQVVIASLVGSVVGLLFYVLRTSGKREQELISHKERLLEILDKYATAVKSLTTQIETMAQIQHQLEARMERIETTLLIMSHSNGISVADNASLNVGGDMTARDKNIR